MRKFALPTIQANQGSPDAQYTLFNRQRVKRFFALSFRQISPDTPEENKKEKRGPKPPQIREHDLVLAFPTGSEGIENEHMLCVVDSLQEEEYQIILKIVLRETK